MTLLIRQKQLHVVERVHYLPGDETVSRIIQMNAIIGKNIFFQIQPVV